MSKNPRRWTEAVKNEYIDVFIGDYIGRGVSRHVYAVLGAPDMVAKVEQRSGSFQNALESEIWNEVQFTKWKVWFAPVIRISSCGMVLLQAKTHPIPPNQYPTELPDFFTDLKPENFGLYKGRVVCHDYALNMFTSNALSKAKLRKVSPKKFGRGFA